MKKFEFKHHQKRWDKYQRFYADDGTFVQFEDGSLGLDKSTDPDVRRMYNQYGIQIVTTTDSDCPELYLRPDADEPVKRAWVSQGGQQKLAIDWERKKAVRLNDTWRVPDVAHHMPENLKHLHAYWAKPNVDPVPLAQIDVSMPDRVVRNSLEKKLEEVRAAVSAIYRMQSDAQRRHFWSAEPMQAMYAWDGMTVEQIIGEIAAHPNLANQYMHNIYHRGFTYPRASQKYDFLYVKGDYS